MLKKLCIFLFISLCSQNLVFASESLKMLVSVFSDDYKTVPLTGEMEGFTLEGIYNRDHFTDPKYVDCHFQMNIISTEPGGLLDNHNNFVNAHYWQVLNSEDQECAIFAIDPPVCGLSSIRLLNFRLDESQVFAVIHSATSGFLKTMLNKSVFTMQYSFMPIIEVLTGFSIEGNDSMFSGFSSFLLTHLTFSKLGFGLVTSNGYLDASLKIFNLEAEDFCLECQPRWIYPKQEVARASSIDTFEEMMF